MAEVIPAILENTFEAIEAKIRKVENLVKWVQIDLEDGTLMPNVTLTDPLPFKELKTPVNLELHLMVKNPLKYVEAFYQAGFKRFYAQVEGENIDEYIEKCYSLGVETGLAIDGPTKLEKIHPFLDNIDGVLVMAIDAGFSGQPFRDDTIDKIKKIKDEFFDLPLSVDGAMNLQNASKVVAAGANRINSNSYIYHSGDIQSAIGNLKKLEGGVR